MTPFQLNQHISQQFNEDLERLKEGLLAMGGLVERQVIDAVNAIENADTGLAEKVMLVEDQIDKKEVELDEECTRVLARRQPAASDLRMVLMVTKANRDFERIGDEANKIAKMAIAISNDGNNNPHGYVELRHLASDVIKMVNQSLDAFARFDAYAALEVVQADHKVDQEYRTAMRELVTYMMEDPRSISRVMNVIWALRALERIGDHARNIAEHIIYLVKGTDVRHIPADQIEEKLAE